MSRTTHVVCRLAALLFLAALAACGSVSSDTPDAASACTRDWVTVGLSNANFDGTAGGWTGEPLSAPPLCQPMDYGFAAHSGELAACFGVENSAIKSLTQLVTLPAGTTQVRLRGQQCFVTTEAGMEAKDTMSIVLQDASTGTSLASIAEWSNLDAAAACAWAPFEKTASLSGETTSGLLVLQGRLDELEVTTFFVDSVELQAFACTP